MSESNTWQLDSVASGWAAMEELQGVTPDLLLLNIPRGDTDGLHLLRFLRRFRPELPIILICDSGDKAKQLEAIRLGARDCLLRPLEDEQFERTIKYHLSAADWDLESEITGDYIEPIGGGAFFVAASPIMRQLRAQAELLAASGVPVMIVGERGSGKETAARLMHKLSARSRFNFAKVNCAALPNDLLEAELFGSENPGGSNGSKPGKLELCRKGTLLLKEITEMPLALQAKLARVIQEKQFVRPATGTSCKADVRFMAASSTPIQPAVSQGKLREDLYYAFSSYTMHVPPLRQRREEVPHLLQYFKQLLAKRFGLSPRRFSPAVLAACQSSHLWPGNVGELENFVKRHLMKGNGQEFGTRLSELEDATTEARSMWLNSIGPQVLSGGQYGAPPWDDVSLKSMVRNLMSEAEKTAIAATLEKTGWNRKAAARQLKVSYRTLLYKIERYQLKPAEARQEG
jgi:DNA-binding NtrC family response regulator